MTMIVGRRSEQDDLEEWCRSRKAELICVYGRRRVGKTYLVESMFRDRFAFSATGSEDKRMKSQLKVFAGALERYGGSSSSAPTDWFEAFNRLRGLLDRPDVIRTENGRRIVFLDEFPWFATKRSDFLVAFANFWNDWASKQRDMVVVVCGSATSWIIKNLFDNTGSMFDRITRRLYIAPFTLRETELMAAALDLGWSREAVLDSYLVFGGLPYYLEMLDRRKSLVQNIDRLCFDVHAPLRNEVPHLMEATLSDSPLHREVLRMLSHSKSGVHRAKIAETLGDGGALSRTLNDLEKCGYIRRYNNPYEKNRPSIYQVVDPFLLFSFKFMEGNVESWDSFVGSPGYYSWRGNAFELACISHIPQIKAALGIAGVQTACFPWTSSSSTPGAQVDLAIERADCVTDLCEMKYTDEPLVISAEHERKLLHKRSAFMQETGTKNAVHLTAVSVHGVARNVHADCLAKTVTLDDLFA